MRITRHHTTAGSAPFCDADLRIFSANSWSDTPVDSISDFEIDVAQGWSIEAAEILAGHCLVPAGIPVLLKAVREDDVPVWLWRHTADRKAIERQQPAKSTRPETGLPAIVDRIAGGWTYQGWKSGYFDTDGDARAFYDETRWLLFHRHLAPEIAVWRHAGVFWAYGLEDVPGGAITDYRTGGMRALVPGDVPPHGAAINGIAAGDGEAGLWDLFQRESALRKAGCALGVNLSLTDPNFSTEAAFEVDAIVSRRSRTPTGSRAISRRLTIDADDEEAISILRRHGCADAAVDLSEAGRTLAWRHLKAIAESCQNGTSPRALDPRKNPALRFAIVAARGAIVPEPVIDRLLRLLRDGSQFTMEDLLGSPRQPAPGDDTTVILRADDRFLDRAVSDDGQAATILDAAALTAWTKGSSGLHFTTTIEGWNSCPDSGEVRSAAGDGDFLFLDDSSVSRMTLHLPAFVTPEGGIDIAGLRHAATMATVALDIAIAGNAAATPRLARRNWDFRPIALAPTGLASTLMAMGYAYDSRVGRNVAAQLCGLVTGSAWAASAKLAEELGPFPAWQVNAGSMQQVLRNHRRAAIGVTGGYEGLGWPPFTHPEPGSPPIEGMEETLAEIWDDALATGKRAGWRNAQVTLIAALERENRVLECQTPGVEPDFSLVRFEKLPGDGYRRVLNPAVIDGLRRRGYRGGNLQRILQHALGRGTLAGAPGINHENLRARGFTADALRVVEAGLGQCLDIAMVFTPWALGRNFCTRMLGLPAAALEAEGFELLTALGYSDAAIEAANAFCCGTGTLEGAPGLDPDHLAVFDCATPQGERGRRRLDPLAVVRMMAAVQPLISGGIGHRVTLPGTSTVADCRETFLMGWRLGIKSLVVNVEPAVDSMLPDAAAQTPDGRESSATLLRMFDGGAVVSASSAAATDARSIAESSSTDTETVIAETGLAGTARDASSSRGPLSNPARSTASAASSPDAVVEQRQV